MCDKGQGCSGGCGRDVGLMAEAIREALIPSHILRVNTQTIGAQGFVQFDGHAPFAAVAVNVVSAGATGITISAGTAAGTTAPSSGPGVAMLPANKGGVFNIHGNALTVWGANGDVVTVQMFTKPQPVAWG